MKKTNKKKNETIKNSVDERPFIEREPIISFVTFAFIILFIIGAYILNKPQQMNNCRCCCCKGPMIKQDAPSEYSDQDFVNNTMPNDAFFNGHNEKEEIPNKNATGKRKDSIARYLNPNVDDTMRDYLYPLDESVILEDSTRNKTLFNGKYKYPEMNEILQYIWKIDDVKYLKPICYFEKSQNKIIFECAYLYDYSLYCNVVIKNITAIKDKKTGEWKTKSINVIGGINNLDRKDAYDIMEIDYK